MFSESKKERKMKKKGVLTVQVLPISKLESPGVPRAVQELSLKNKEKENVRNVL